MIKKTPQASTFNTLTSYLVSTSLLRTGTDPDTVTYHDPCHLGRGIGCSTRRETLLKELESDPCLKWIITTKNRYAAVPEEEYGNSFPSSQKHRSKKSQRSRRSKGRPPPHRLPLMQTQFEARRAVGRENQGHDHAGISLWKEFEAENFGSLGRLLNAPSHSTLSL